jgi:UDP-4-amino-4-deoxy-L-arabinose-oxoglutarate aminotransferase
MSEPVRPSFLAFSQPTIERDEIDEVVDSLTSGWITSGPKVVRFEAMFREHLGVPEAIAVGSATAGWQLVVAALGIGPGDEVIVPAITWPSMANIVELAGACAVFADVRSDTLQIDSADVARRISPRTRAIVPVHFAGAACDLDALRAVIADRPIALVEDAAHALGTAYRGRPIGSDSSIAIFSFHAIKNITTGEGGMIVCRDPALARRLRLLRAHGITRDTWDRYRAGGSPDFEIEEPGYKCNMLDLQAALGLRQLPKLARFNARRAELAARYDRLLAAVPEVRPLAPVDYPARHAHHLYVVRLDAARLAVSRDEFLVALARENIGTGLHFPAVHLKRYYRDRYGYTAADLPNAAALGASIFSLPLYPALSDQDVDDVVRALARVIAASGPTGAEQLSQRKASACGS